GSHVGVLLLRPLQDDLDVRFGHRLPDVPVHDVAVVAVQDAAQVVERSADVGVGNINVLLLMCGQWLYEASALLRRADGNDVGIVAEEPDCVRTLASIGSRATVSRRKYRSIVNK